MTFRVIPVETMTGRRILPWVEVGDFSWKASLTQPGRGSFPLHLRDQARWGGRSLAEMRAISARLGAGWGTTYVVETGPDEPRPGQIVYAGMLVDQPSWAGGVMTVRTRELAAILARRSLFTAEEMVTVNQRTYSGPNMGDVIRDVMYGALKRPALGSDSLPIDVPTGQPGGTLSKQVFRYNFPTAQQVLDDIAAEGGPDWYFRPYWAGSLLRWQLEVGAPELSGGEIRLPVSTVGVPVKSSVVDFSMSESFADQYTHVVAVGAGSEADMRWAQYEGATPTGVPNMFRTESHKHLDDPRVLKAVAAQSSRMASKSVRQFSFGVHTEVGGRVTPDMVRVGSRLLLDHPGDERVDAGRYREYVMEVSGSASGLLSVESQGV